MQIKFFRPRNPLLSTYMEGYYFLAHGAEDQEISYLTFPNNYSILTFCTDTIIRHEGDRYRISGIPSAGCLSELICHYKQPLRICYEGAVKEITFYFKPLGLNAFLPQPLSAYTADMFRRFEPYEDFLAVMSAILEEPDEDTRCKRLECYWLSRLTGFEHPFLHAMVGDMQDRETVYTIEELAAKYGTTRQQIYKQFELHLCKTPVAFRKIQRFRDALLQSIDSRRKKETLAALSYDAAFYDQSHLIKDFKAFTGHTPKKFFEKISLQENAAINWLYLQ